MKTDVKKLISTERGPIWVECEVDSKKEAIRLGYTYNFYLSDIKAHCFSVVTWEKKRIFCLVKDKKASM